MTRLVWLDTRGAHAVYIVGKRRSGKTYTLGVLAEGLASDSWVGQGECDKQAVLLIDTLNVYGGMHYPAANVLAKDSPQVRELDRWKLPMEAPTVRYLVPSGTRPPDDAETLHLAIRPCDLASDDWAGVFGLDTFSDPMGQLIADCLEVVRDTGYDCLDGGFRKATGVFDVSDLICALDSASRLQVYEHSTRGGLARRLRALDRLGVFSSTGTPISSIFQRGVVTVALLGNLDVLVRALVIGLFTKRILETRQTADQLERALLSLKGRLAHDQGMASKQREKSEQSVRDMETQLAGALPRGWLLIDEAHNYIPQTGVLPSRPHLRRYVNEGRNMGLSIAMATQQPSGLDSSIRRNANVLLIHSMSMRDDIDATQAMLNTVAPDAVSSTGSSTGSKRGFERMVRSLDPGFVILSNDTVNRIFPIRIRPRLTLHGGLEY